MLRSKENTDIPLHSEFIQYLYSEFKRQSPTNTSMAYSEIIRFTKTPEGQKAFEQFKTIDRTTLGLTPISKPTYKRAFQL